MILIGANQDSVFARLCRAMERPELAEDARYRDHGARGEQQQALDELIAGWTRTLAADALLEVLESNGVPAGRIYRAPEMLADPQFAASGALIEVPDAEGGSSLMVATPVDYSRTPVVARSHAPRRGQHTEEILAELTQRRTND